jgi:hypothetical protein
MKLLRWFYVLALLGAAACTVSPTTPELPEPTGGPSMDGGGTATGAGGATGVPPGGAS